MKWVPWVASLILLIIVIFLWKRTGVSPVPKFASKEDSLKAVIFQRDSIDRWRDVQVSLQDAAYQHDIDSLTVIASARKDSLKQAKTRIWALSRSIGTYIVKTGDTVLKKSYDSLQKELDSAYVMVNSYATGQDQVIATLGKEISFKDSVINTLNIEVKDLKQVFTTSAMNFDNLKKYSDLQEKKIKRQSVWSKIAMGLSFAVGAVFGHGLK